MFATIQEENTNNEVYSNEMGEFEITVRDSLSIIVVSSISSKPIPFKINNWINGIILLKNYSGEHEYNALNGSNYRLNYTEKICGLSLNSGLNYVPLGFSIDLYLPYLFSFALLPKIQYATDLNGNYYYGFSLFIPDPLFRLNNLTTKFLYDLNVYNIALETPFRLMTNKLEVYQNIDLIKSDLICGIGLSSADKKDFSTKAAILLGFNTYIWYANLEIGGEAAYFFAFTQYKGSIAYTLKSCRLNLGLTYDQIIDYKAYSIKLRYYFTY